MRTKTKFVQEVRDTEKLTSLTTTPCASETLVQLFSYQSVL